MKLFLFTILISISTLNATTPTGCAEPLAAIASQTSQDKWIKDKVELVWYPKAGYSLISHTELAVDGTLWDATIGFKTKTSVDVAERGAKTGEKGFFRFKLAVTPEELKNLENFLEERRGKLAFQMCIGGACKAIKSSTGIIIPFPFSKIPTLAAIYLTVMHKLGYSRITKVEYMGKNAIKNLISTEVPYELATAGSLALGLVVTAIGASGQISQFIVPVVQNQDDDDKTKFPETPERLRR